MGEIKLDVCKHCGGSPNLHRHVGESWVECVKCGISTGMTSREDVAVATWNTRTPPVVTEEMVERAARGMFCQNEGWPLSSIDNESVVFWFTAKGEEYREVADDLRAQARIALTAALGGRDAE